MNFYEHFDTTTDRSVADLHLSGGIYHCSNIPITLGGIRQWILSQRRHVDCGRAKDPNQLAILYSHDFMRSAWGILFCMATAAATQNIIPIGPISPISHLR